MKPLAVDLCCGLGGWSEGLLAEGWDVVGFDVERHQYGDAKYPAQLVLQDIRTIDGRQFRGKVSLIVASPPCQKFSYMAMPWKRAKALAVWYRDPEYPERLTELTALFDACVRIGKEAECPIVIENVCGAQPWVGRARWNFGSFYLFGDVPALMPMTNKRKHSGASLEMGAPKFARAGVDGATKNSGGSWFAIGSPGQKELSRNPVHDHIKNKDADGYERDHPAAFGWKKPRTSSHSNARKAASAAIAKIPFVLASYIAQVFKPG